MKNPIPKLADCIKYVESAGYKYSHRSIAGTYVFYSPFKRQDGSFVRQLAFTLSEIRDAFRNGF